MNIILFVTCMVPLVYIFAWIGYYIRREYFSMGEKVNESTY